MNQIEKDEKKMAQKEERKAKREKQTEVDKEEKQGTVAALSWFTKSKRGLLAPFAVGTVDQVTGWNYGYLCRKPAVPSLLDYLGPWPWYLIGLEAIAIIMFVVVYLPFAVKDGLARRQLAHQPAID